ncbi:hypothetical protein ACHAXM_011589 [Skeletonema potamos]
METADSNDTDAAADDGDEEMMLHEHNNNHHPRDESNIRHCKSLQEASSLGNHKTTKSSTAAAVQSVVMMDDDEEEMAATMKLPASSEADEEDVNMMSTSFSAAESTSVSLHLTPEEERLFTLLINAAESYERGELVIDPNPTETSVSARGGFAKTAAKECEEQHFKTNNHHHENNNNNNDTNEEDVLLVASWLKPPPRVDHIEIRIAGGWVRDKLLNQHSVDVDVALDCMMGVQFARIVQTYLAASEKDDDDEEEEDSKRRDGKEEKNEMMMVEDVDDDQRQSNDKPPSQRGHEETKKGKKKKNRQPKIGVIGANPSQSKHLETATMNIHGIDIDFVNLRAEEVYVANSRIPTSQTRMFGSPLEDALRRDFTINSLFYNIRTGKVEDWTGRGLTDLLDNRLIVTPVDPHETFHDDPLRVLRAIRFCVRLDFSLHEDIIQAAMCKRVHHSLHVKVSRERVGKELEGMLTGKHARPGRALDMIAELHLAGSVFAFPGSFPGDSGHVFGPVTGKILGVDYHGCCGKDGPEAVALAATHRARGWDESSALLALLPKVMESHVDERDRFLLQPNLHEQGDSNGSHSAPAAPSVMDTRLLHICAFILPFHNLTFPDAKGRACSVTAHMIKEAVKFSTKDIQAISKILEHVDEMAEILSEIRSQLLQQAQEGGGAVQLSPPCRLRVGLLLRSLKEHWITCLLTAAAWEIRSCDRQRGSNSGTDAFSTCTTAEQPSRHFYRAIVGELDLDECWRIRPHLNGKEIIKELSLPKGPLVGVYIEDQTRWMLLNPTGTRDECMAHLVERKREREQEVVKEGEDDVTVDDQNESNVGVANGDGQTSPDNSDGSKHFSKKFRSDTVQEADTPTIND